MFRDFGGWKRIPRVRGRASEVAFRPSSFKKGVEIHLVNVALFLVSWFAFLGRLCAKGGNWACYFFWLAFPRWVCWRVFATSSHCCCGPMVNSNGLALWWVLFFSFKCSVFFFLLARGRSIPVVIVDF